MSLSLLYSFLLVVEVVTAAMSDVAMGIHRLNIRQLHAEPTDVRRFGNVSVLCTDSTMGIQFNRDVHFGGRIFASRMERNPMCVQHYSPTSMRNRFEVPLNSLTCGVKASKKNPPPGGMEYSVNIVLSYNHMYLTEDDLMYNVKCSYPSAEKAVGTMYEASLLPRASAVGEIAAPVCNYSLHMGSLNGPSPSTALIGQKVYHKWQCNTQDFSLKVYRCYVHNGQQKKYLLVDDEGCSLDPSILPELVYDRELNYVYATSSVFRFTDTSKVYFNCLLYMCPKGEPSCQKNIPPKCYSSGLKRGRRASKFPENLTIERNHHAIIVQSPSLQQNIDEEEDRAIARCELAFYSRAAFVTLVVSNFLSLAIASFAVLYVYRRHFSAQLDIQ